MPFQLSPGVAVVEKDFSSIVPAVSSSVGAFAGSFAWGPVLQPQTVSSENVLVTNFGYPTDSNFASFFSAANFLSYANNLLLVRADSTLGKNAVASKTGGLATVTINAAGSGYSSTAAAPAVTVSAPDQLGGTQAVVTVEISGGAITAIAVTNGGSGYSTAPTININSPSGGFGATFTVNMTGTVPNQSVSTITVVGGGTGYKGTVTAAFSAGNAVAGGVTIASSGITNPVIVTAGTGYSSAPTVTVAAPPSGTTASLNRTISTAGVKIKNSEEYLASFTNGGGVVGEFAAKYPGALGNSITVSYADSVSYAAWAYKAEFDSAPGTSTFAASVGGSLDELHIVVVDNSGVWTGTPGTVLEKFAFASKAVDGRKPYGTNNHYKNVINTNSKYVWWMDYNSTCANWGSGAAGTTFATIASAVT
jgi:hypothetical protein